MNKTGPVVIIEDDENDQEILVNIFKTLDYKNEVVFFSDGDEALHYLMDVNNKPFLVISDINMPKLNGLELREKIHNNEELRLRCIPYLFFTANASKNDVVTAYSKSVQGFFVKPSSYRTLKKTIEKTVGYWQECIAPDAQP